MVYLNRSDLLQRVTKHNLVEMRILYGSAFVISFRRVIFILHISMLLLTHERVVQLSHFFHSKQWRLYRNFSFCAASARALRDDGAFTPVHSHSFMSNHWRGLEYLWPKNYYLFPNPFFGEGRRRWSCGTRAALACRPSYFPALYYVAQLYWISLT